MKSDQYGTPILLLPEENQSIKLQRIDLANNSGSPYDEKWLQQKIHENPALIPVGEIDPIFGDLIPVCQELTSSVGRLDNLYVNELGLLTLVECKLWRNPEARRKVVGQILDYAQEFSRMDYDDLIGRINARTGLTGNSLYDIVSERVEGISEKSFVDSVTRNLAKGRFLLLIVGDGIHENVENIASYLQQYAQLNFTLALVEQAIYTLDHGEQLGILVQPRTIAKTAELEIAKIKLEGDTTRIKASLVSPTKEAVKTSSVSRRGSITEQVYYEGIEGKFPGLSESIRALFRELEQKGYLLDVGSSAIMIKTSDK